VTGSVSVVSTPSPRDQRPDRKLSIGCDGIKDLGCCWWVTSL
jgi:hypothetical protein